ncbi:MAG: alpha/beta hydrolase [Actinomycetota bacterium]|nr:alpha/beta hydrolase [Actinomycetota bacterium]
MDIAALETHRQFATTGSGPVSYLDVGRGRPAIFVHGIITNSLLWRHVISAVASPQRRCIALDLPGHGQTPPAAADSDVSLTGLAHRVIELCDHLNLDQVDLVANDTGGAVAQIAAVHLGDRLATLTLTDCDTEGHAPPWQVKPFALAARLRLLEVMAPRALRNPRRARSAYATGYQHLRRVPSEVLDGYWRPVFGTRQAARAFARLLASISSADLTAVRSRLAQLSAPTLIVWGTDDMFFNIKWAHRLAGLIPGSQVATIPGARLFFPEERASEFIPLLEQHWQARENSERS